MIRAELAHDAEFRRRFRGEVARARQVPPFCTAEVLDADAEHDPAYLVVEYVDGPSLAAVVAKHGPLSHANQQSIAVGVAVALTAIHGVGVIHRDLKPGNVLLAPGSPKVIDFGIARGTSTTRTGTPDGQWVGTVAYMAPELFGPDASRALSPAADVFAWGVVVAYAATGRTPFAADFPAAVALRIVAQPPDLDGLRQPLRDLVRRALAKDPADRPTARELVDHLLAGGVRANDRTSTFATQPEVLAAAGIAVPSTAIPGIAAAGIATPAATLPAPGSGRVGPAVGAAPVGAPIATAPTAAPERRARVSRSAVTRATVAALAITVLLLAGTIAGVATGTIPLGAGVRTGPSPAPAASSPAAPRLGPAASVAPGATIFVKNSLAQADIWRSVADTRHGATCVPDGRLTVTLGDATVGSYRCPGVSEIFTDFSVLVDVTVLNTTSCAGVWFRYTDEAGGYALRICPTRYELVSHTGGVLTPLGTFFSGVGPSPVGRTVHVGVRAEGDTLWFFRDGETPQSFTDTRFQRGRVVLGVMVSNGADPSPPFGASFANVQIYRSPTVPTP